MPVPYNELEAQGGFVKVGDCAYRYETCELFAWLQPLTEPDEQGNTVVMIQSEDVEMVVYAYAIALEDGSMGFEAKWAISHVKMTEIVLHNEMVARKLFPALSAYAFRG